MTAKGAKTSINIMVELQPDQDSQAPDGIEFQFP
jgi:hypothetical protein